MPGVDPLTGKDHYLTESTRDETEAQKILTRLLAAVDERRNPRTKATLGAVVASWLRAHELLAGHNPGGDLVLRMGQLPEA
jgi:integrase